MIIKYLLIPTTFTLNLIAGQHQFVIRSHSYNGGQFWTPNQFVVYQGDEVTLKLVNEGSTTVQAQTVSHSTSATFQAAAATSHYFEVEELVPTLEVKKGTVVEATFQAKKVGIYKIKNSHESLTDGRVIVIERSN